MKMKLIMVALITVVIIIASVSLYYLKYDTSHETIYYDINIDVYTSKEYVISCPIPLDENNNSQLIDELKIIQGTGEWKLVDNSYGKMLEIKSSTSLHLRAQKIFTDTEYISKGYLEYSTLINKNMSNGDNKYILGQVWIGAVKSNYNISLNITLGHKNYIGTGPIIDTVNVTIMEIWTKQDVERIIGVEPTT
jgi:hypothetical protein